VARGGGQYGGDAAGMSGGSVGGGDSLYGDGGGVRCGDDRIVGGRGEDLMFGDLDPSQSDLASITRGADTFVIRRGGGRDTIGDFEPGRDTALLRGFGGLAAADVAAAPASGGGLVLDLGAAVGGQTGIDLLALPGVSGLGPADIVVA
jgi:hypothetical protein